MGCPFNMAWRIKHVLTSYVPSVDLLPFVSLDDQVSNFVHLSTADTVADGPLNTLRASP